jgi:hypothetical protein
MPSASSSGGMYLARRPRSLFSKPYRPPAQLPGERFHASTVPSAAGFVSKGCRRYLRVGGDLVANSSRGDASMAAVDPGYELVAVYRRRSGRFLLCLAGIADSWLRRLSHGSPPAGA